MSSAKKKLIVKLDLARHLLNTEQRRIMATRSISQTPAVRTSLARSKTPVEDRETRNLRLGVDDGDSIAGDTVDGDIIENSPMDGDDIRVVQRVFPYTVQDASNHATSSANGKQPITMHEQDRAQFQTHHAPQPSGAAASRTTHKRQRNELNEEDNTPVHDAKRQCRTIDYSRVDEPKRSELTKIYSCIVSNWDEKGFQVMMDKMHDRVRTSISWENNKAMMEELRTLSYQLKDMPTRIPSLVAAERFLKRELKRRKSTTSMVPDRVTAEVVRTVSLKLKQGLYNAEISPDVRQGAQIAALVDCLADGSSHSSGHNLVDSDGNGIQQCTAQAGESHQDTALFSQPGETMPGAPELEDLPRHDSVTGDNTTDRSTLAKGAQNTTVPVSVATTSQQLRSNAKRPSTTTFPVAETVPGMTDPLTYATNAAAKVAGNPVLEASSQLTRLMLETRRAKEERAMSAGEEKESIRKADHFAQNARDEQLKAEEHTKKAQHHELQARLHAQCVKENKQKAVEYGQKAAEYTAKGRDFERAIQAMDEEAKRVCEDAGNEVKRVLRQQYQTTSEKEPGRCESVS